MSLSARESVPQLGLYLTRSPFLLRQLMLRPTMDTLLVDVGAPAILLALRMWTRSRAALQLEILALRHQLQVLQRTRPGWLRLSTMDRCLWVMLSRIWTGWRTSLVIVKPETAALIVPIVASVGCTS
jgi:hypothetical protein